MVDTEKSMKDAFTAFQAYCNLWKLKVNISKTKLLLFCRRYPWRTPIFQFNGKEIEILDEYCYLGLLMKYAGKYAEAKKKLISTQ